MSRWIGLFTAWTCVAAGCSRSASTPPPVAPPAVATANDKAIPADTAVQPPANPAPPTAKSGTDNGLRSLLARYLVSDGQGGWRPDEKAATEVEKLAPPASQLIPLLTDSQAEVRRGAAFGLLSQFDPTQPEQVAAITGMLTDQDSAVRSIGRSAVSQMRTADQVAAAPNLATQLTPAREAKPDNRAAIARLLGTLKAEAAPALSPLTAAAAGDPDAKVRAACYAAIVQIAPPGEAVAPLVKGLADTDASVRVVATAQLRKLAAAAAPAAKELAAVLADADQRVRENATEALILIGQPAVEPLAAALAGKQVEAKKYALVALAKIGAPAKAALPAIEKLAVDPDPSVQKLAAEALKRIQP
jgi:HEAT repeat protein